ncbi:MAG: hypothetical protein CMO01_30485 [Thalassobius sp.]|nr:hypothetical protein [Thalassovita sp.]
MITEIENLKNRAKILSNYFEIRDGETRQMLISTTMNNPENKKFNEVIDEFVVNETLKTIEVRIGNSQADAKRSVYYISAAGSDSDEVRIMQPQQNYGNFQGFNGHPFPSGAQGKQSQSEYIESLVNARLETYNVQFEKRLFEFEQLAARQNFESELKYKDYIRDLEHKLQLVEEEKRRFMIEEKERREKEKLQEEIDKLKDRNTIINSLGAIALNGFQSFVEQKNLGGLFKKEKQDSNQDTALPPTKNDTEKVPEMTFKIKEDDAKADSIEEDKKYKALLGMLAGLNEEQLAIYSKAIEEGKNDEHFLEDLKSFMEEEDETAEEVKPETKKQEEKEADPILN